MAKKSKKRDRPAPSALARPESVLDPKTAALLFSPEEVARLKLAILTGVDAAAKIEAIRKMTFTAVDAAEKGALFLKAVTDADSSVRREGAAALQTLGMGAEFADVLSTVASGTPRQKVLGLSKLKASAAGLRAPERSIALMFLSSSLGYEGEPEVRAAMLAALAELVAPDGLPAGGAAPVLRAVIKAVAEDYQGAAPAARPFFARLARAAGVEAADVLWHEVRPIEDRRLKLFLMTQLLPLPMAPALKKEVCAAAAAVVSRDDVDDLEARDLDAAFSLLGDEASEALLPMAAGARESQLPALVGLMGAAARSSSAAGRARMMDFFLEAWPRCGRTARAAILESRLLSHEDIDAGRKLKLARLAIDGLHSSNDPERPDAVRSALRRLGAAALPALREAIDRSPYPAEREAAAAAVADICAEAAVDEATLADLIGMFRALEDGVRIRPGLAVRCAGRLVERLRGNGPLADEVVASFRKRLGRVSFMDDLLVALCHAAASPAAHPQGAAEMALTILEFLRGRMPDPSYAERMGPEGREIQIGRESAVYTDLIPELLEGLRRLYVSAHLAERLRGQVVDELLALWGRVVNYEEIWAPGNLIQLGEALAEMGRLTRGASRERILKTMIGSIRNTGVVRALAPLCGDPEDRSEGYAALMGAIAAELFRMLGMEEYRDLADRQAILVTLGRVAGSARLGAREREGEELRHRIVERIIEEGAPTAREMVDLVEWLKASPAVPAELKRFGATPARRG